MSSLFLVNMGKTNRALLLANVVVSGFYHRKKLFICSFIIILSIACAKISLSVPLCDMPTVKRASGKTNIT